MIVSKAAQTRGAKSGGEGSSKRMRRGEAAQNVTSTESTKSGERGNLNKKTKKPLGTGNFEGKAVLPKGLMGVSKKEKKRARVKSLK